MSEKDFCLSQISMICIKNILVNLYIWLTISPSYGSNALDLGLIERDGGLSALCHSCGFDCHQRVLKTFLGPDYLRSKNGVVWLWYLLVNLYIWLNISSCYGSIPLALRLIGRDGGLSTLHHICGFACQKRVLKTFSGSGYLRFKDR